MTSLLLRITFLVSLTSVTALEAQTKKYGAGCNGSRGVPSIAFYGSHAAGAPARIVLSAGPASAPVVLLFGTSNKTSTLGPLPLDLGRFPGFGKGCLLLTSAEVSLPLLTDKAGSIDLSFRVPRLPGLTMYLQFACVDSVNPFRFTMSNGLEAKIGPPGVRVTGQVRTSSGPVTNARVTIFDPTLALFLEARTNSTGSYDFDGVPPGTWRLGVSSRDLAYSETTLIVTRSMTQTPVLLKPETHRGRWTVIGNTLPHTLDATDMAVLLPDGRVWFCHDTVDPVIFDPVTAKKDAPIVNTKKQGCFNSLLLEDGNILVIGGQDGSAPNNFRMAVRWTKRFDVTKKSYTQLQDLLNLRGRWYPGLCRLADGSPLVLGGGQRPDAKRTATCERYDPKTGKWSWAASMSRPSEFSPTALLYTGEVLKTWSPPELYDPTKNTWRATGDFVQRSRGWPGHSDHSLVVLGDGRVLTVGCRDTKNGRPVMAEIYDSKSGKWTLTSNSALPRHQSEVVQLPDGRVLAAAGESSVRPVPVPNKLGIVKYCDIYDPSRNRWRRVADMIYYHEYHAVTLLIPDGRVISTGGTVIKFRNKPVTADIEGYQPPYMFRGVRPQITGISGTTFSRGQQLSFSIFPATRITSVVLVGFGAHTHWLNSGVKRRIVVAPTQIGSSVKLTLPSDRNVLPDGYYMLFAMVDDIPSVARIARIR